jgi:hypothetical protein
LLRNYREKWASFAYFEGKGGRISLQLRLAGGRDWDSNRRYLFESGKYRRWRKLQLINKLTREFRGARGGTLPQKRSIFEFSLYCERHTIVWLKVVTFGALAAESKFGAYDYLLGAQSAF